MGDTTNISYCDHTWNPWLGCEPVHTGCLRCFAQAYFKRMGIIGKRRRTSDANWKKPLTWNQQAACDCEEALYRLADCAWCSQGCPRPRVLCSLMDPFEDWQGPIVNAKDRILLHNNADIPYIPAIPGQWMETHSKRVTMTDLRRDMFRVIDECQNLDFILATKRPKNIRRMWPPTPMSRMASILAGRRPNEGKQRRRNCWLLYSASDQKTLEAGIGHLLKCRDLVSVLGLSLEPLIRPVTISERVLYRGARLSDLCGLRSGREPADLRFCDGLLDWVIIGGESGPSARPCNLAWIRDILDECRAIGLPCFVKQVGRKPFEICEPSSVAAMRNGWNQGRVDYTPKDCKGGDPAEWSTDLRVQQFPELTR